MKIKDKAKPPIPPLPGGSYLGTCVYSIDIGEQLCKYKDTERYNNQIVLGFEIMGKTVEIDGKQEPRVLSRTFTVSRSANSGLRKFVGSWTGQQISDDAFAELDTNDLVGFPAMLSVVLSEDKQYSNIDSIMPVPEVLAPHVQAPQSTLIRFDLEPFDEKAFEALPDWAKERIKKSTDWAKSHADTSVIEAKPEAGGGMNLAALLANLQAGNGGAAQVTVTDPSTALRRSPSPASSGGLTADPETGEVIETGGNASPTGDGGLPVAAPTDRKGGVPF
ncbi:MAG: hypothetical protein IKS05_09145 [Oscillospiraceae bacterium]|nr:hypothetical protein [Oscillospiraceae bacterium]